MVMSVLFLIVFVIIIGIFIFSVINGLRTWNKNNSSPTLSKPAKVISKRQDTILHNQPVSADGTGANGYHTITENVYYAEFQFKNKTAEFHVSHSDYAMLTEGDSGILTFQGTRYLSFKK